MFAQALSEIEGEHVVIGGMAIVFVVDRILSQLKSRGVDVIKIAKQVDESVTRLATLDAWLSETKVKISKALDDVEDLREWHNSKDENGVFRWWVTTQLMDMMKKQSESLDVMGAEIRDIKRMLNGGRK